MKNTSTRISVDPVSVFIGGMVLQWPWTHGHLKTPVLYNISGIYKHRLLV